MREQRHSQRRAGYDTSDYRSSFTGTGMLVYLLVVPVFGVLLVAPAVVLGAAFGVSLLKLVEYTVCLFEDGVSVQPPGTAHPSQ